MHAVTDPIDRTASNSCIYWLSLLPHSEKLVGSVPRVSWDLPQRVPTVSAWAPFRFSVLLQQSRNRNVHVRIGTTFGSLPGGAAARRRTEHRPTQRRRCRAPLPSAGLPPCPPSCGLAWLRYYGNMGSGLSRLLISVQKRRRGTVQQVCEMNTCGLAAATGLRAGSAFS